MHLLVFSADRNRSLKLPDKNDFALELARRFWPRYIAPRESDFFDVTAVLKKMASVRKADKGRERIRQG